MEIPDLLNPFQILNINVNASPRDVKLAFRQKICSSERHQRAMLTLAYDMICSRNPSRYIKFDSRVVVNKKDHFYYVITGNYELFVAQIKKQKSLLNEKDEYGRTLLYLAARSGFHNICNFLLKSGCDINEIQKDESTALHAASFYGQKLIIELLLEYGANPGIKNSFGNDPKDEAISPDIKKCILSKTDDKVSTLLNVLKKGGFTKHMVLIKHQDKIIGKKILRNSEYSTSLLNDWTVAWHGTKYQHLESIMKYGLHPAGTTLSPGKRISTQAGHIALNKKVGTYENWANAVFISPSIFYAADVVYSERIFSDQQRWCVIVETRVKPGSFTTHKQTLLNQRQLLPGEPENLEYRVAVNADENFIMRVESNQNVIVTALVFVNLTFLENIDEYYQGGGLFANSEAERALFQ